MNQKYFQDVETSTNNCSHNFLYFAEYRIIYIRQNIAKIKMNFTITTAAGALTRRHGGETVIRDSFSIAHAIEKD